MIWNDAQGRPRDAGLAMGAVNDLDRIPLVRGGQGRSAPSIGRDAMIFVLVLGLCLAVMAGAGLWAGCFT